MASREEIHAKLTGYMQEIFGLEPDKITLDARLVEDLDLDSIDAVELVVKLQEYTGRKMAPGDFKSVRTIGDIVDIVERIA